MKKKAASKTKFYKSETLFLAVMVAFAAGFLAGTIFAVYRTSGASITQGPSSPPAGGGTPPQKSASDPQIAVLQARTAENPSDTAAWIELGNRYFDAGRGAESISAYKKALSLDDRNANVWTDLGVMYRRTGEPRKAIESFDSALRVDPNHQVARFNKGIVLMHDLQDREGALRVWNELAAINPGFQTPTGQSLSDMLSRMRPAAKNAPPGPTATPPKS